MSEFFEEYTHIVADSTKTWPYFDIPSCLKILPWSYAECFSRIRLQWYVANSGWTRHAVVQLALYTCQPFRDITPARSLWINAPEGYIDGYIIDQSELKNGEQKQRKYPCRSVTALIEPLATALMDYEFWCEQDNWWPRFERDRDRCIKFLENFSWVPKDFKRRDITPNDPVLQHNRWLEKYIQRLIKAIHAFTYKDYQRTYNPTNEPRSTRSCQEV